MGPTTHFCGLPRAVTWSFRLVKPFMSARSYAAMKLKPDFSHLREKHAPASSLLPRWDKQGTLDFDLDAYIEWRAREEGVEVCGRGAGRAFGAGDDDAAMNAAGAGRLSLEELMSDDEAGVLKHGAIDKRGSGRGVFGNRKWKRKHLVVRGGLAAYFTTADVTAANVATRMIPLGPGCSCARAPREGLGLRGPAAPLVLTTPLRDYTFGSETDADADSWVEALRKGIAEAEAIAEGLVSGDVEVDLAE